MHKLNVHIIKEMLTKKDNMTILVLLGILLLVIAWPVEGNEKKGNEISGLWDRKESNVGNKEEEYNYGKDVIDYGKSSNEEVLKEEYIAGNLEKRLEEILYAMEGVGQVKVMITLSSAGEKIVEKDIPLDRNNILEEDSQGGSRSTNQMYSKEETVYATNANGDKTPYVVKEMTAEISGVTVVAQGGAAPHVQNNISEVIQALFGIEEHKIKVVKMKNQE